MTFSMEVKSDHVVVYRKSNRGVEIIAKFFTKSAMALALTFLEAIKKSNILV